MSGSSRALLRRLSGFLVGFIVALTIIVVTEEGRRATAPEVEVVGTPDVFTYCREDGELELVAALSTNDAAGWRCVGRRNGIFGFDVVDFDHVCQTQHGSQTRAISDDPSSPYSWRCIVTR